MKTIGLIGGMSWESSALYYRLINEETNRRHGGHHNAKSLMATVDFADIVLMQHQGSWEQLGVLLGDAARCLERGGAELIVLCTNTMHKVADAITSAVEIPFLHIVDATAASIQESGHGLVGLLGTQFTMEDGFYIDRLRDNFGIKAIVPSLRSRQVVHDIIYRELCQGVIRQESRDQFQQVIDELGQLHAEAVILGCTEIELLISAQDSSLPVFPSTTIHAQAAVKYALQENGGASNAGPGRQSVGPFQPMPS
jgi:aspartate racemase